MRNEETILLIYVLFVVLCLGMSILILGCLNGEYSTSEIECHGYSGYFYYQGECYDSFDGNPINKEYCDKCK